MGILRVAWIFREMLRFQRKVTASFAARIDRRNIFLLRDIYVADSDLQIRGALSSRPRDKGGPASKKFLAFWASVWSKNKGGLPWIRHCFNKELGS